MVFILSSRSAMVRDPTHCGLLILRAEERSAYDKWSAMHKTADHRGPSASLHPRLGPLTEAELAAARADISAESEVGREVIAAVTACPPRAGPSWPSRGCGHCAPRHLASYKTFLDRNATTRP